MPSRPVLDAGGLQIERVDVRPPPGRHQQVGALDGFLGVAGEHDFDALAQPPHALDLDAAADRDALTRERVEHDGGAFGILLAERLRRVQHGDLGAEPAERLRQFEPDRAAAEHDQMLRQFAKLERIFVGEIGRLLDPGNRRHHRPRAGRDHESARPDLEP